MDPMIMVPKMGLSRSVVLPERMEEDEGGTWRWYTNQGVERARPPPKPNERHMSPWWYHSIAHDEYHDHVPAPSSPTYNDNGMTSTAHQQPLAPDGSYINDNKPNDEGQWGYLYHPIAHDWYRVPNDDYGTTTTAASQYGSNNTINNKLMWINRRAGTDRQVQPAHRGPNEQQQWYDHASPSSPAYSSGGMTSTAAPYRSHSMTSSTDGGMPTTPDNVVGATTHPTPVIITSSADTPIETNDHTKGTEYLYSTGNDWYHVPPSSFPSYDGGKTTTTIDRRPYYQPHYPYRWSNNNHHLNGGGTNDQCTEGAQIIMIIINQRSNVVRTNQIR